VSRKVSSSELVARVQRGERAAVARLISRSEQGEAEARQALGKIYRLAGRAHVIGITGVPGSGKSTLVGKLTETLRAKGARSASSRSIRRVPIRAAPFWATASA